MATILYIGTSGTDDGTKAGLPFIMANGAIEAGHQPSIALAGDATYLAKDSIAAATVPVGFPPIKELLEKAVAGGARIYV